MSNPPPVKVKEIIRIAPKQVRCVVCEISQQGAECDVLFVDQGKKLKQRVKWQNDAWEFQETAGSAEGPLYQGFFDALEGKIPKPKGEQGSRRSYRRK